MTNDLMIHSSADVRSKNIGPKSKIGEYVVVLPNANIGCEVNIGPHCYVENGVNIGDRTIIQSGVHLRNGTIIGDDVFIGPNVTFLDNKDFSLENSTFIQQINIEKGASIGAGCVLAYGITIGSGALVAPGSVVMESIPSNAKVKGSPAEFDGYVGDANPAALNEDLRVSQLGVGKATLHQLKLVCDIRGDLSVGNFGSEIPFLPRRYFLIFNVPSSESRGEHAHHRCKQFLICVKGSCAVVVDSGFDRKEILLDQPNLGLYLPPMTWGVQYRYSKDAVLLVFASELYEPDDYIRDYEEFLLLAKVKRDKFD